MDFTGTGMRWHYWFESIPLGRLKPQQGLHEVCLGMRGGATGREARPGVASAESWLPSMSAESWLPSVSEVAAPSSLRRLRVAHRHNEESSDTGLNTLSVADFRATE